MPNLNFRTNAKVESLVGRDLITNNIIAIFELVKNSYDAGATEVEINLCEFSLYDEKNVISTENSYIEIRDNGKGMTSNEIKEFWMELGTPSKENNRYSEVRMRKKELDNVANRLVNGEKGIGRFGVDKIGSYLKMTSVDKNMTEKTIVHFDWSKFDDRSKLIEDIPCEYEIFPVEKGETSGLSLEIHNLRDEWYGRDVVKLKRSLKKFLSPIPIEQDEFKIMFNYDYKENGENYEDSEEIVNDSFDYLKTSIYAKIDTNGVLNYEIYDKGDVVKSDNYPVYQNSSSFGSATVKIFYLDPTDKRAFTTKMGMRPSDYGNIKIFRDNFRVMPYGEPYNDWLAIDKMHAQGIFRSFGTRDLVGHILLSHDPSNKNHVLREATDRVGLIEDVQEFLDLKNFTWKLIKILQEYIFNRIKSEAKESTEVLKRETEDLKTEASGILTSFKNIINDIDISVLEKETLLSRFEDSSKDFLNSVDTVERASKEIEKSIKIFSQITSKEGILYEMLHTIKNKLTVIDAQIRDFEFDIKDAGLNIETRELHNAFKDIYKLVDGSLDKVNSTKLSKKVVPINELIIEVLGSQKSLLESQNINVEINLKLSSGVKIRCSTDSIKNVLENLFSNSVKALNSCENKIIVIDTKINEGLLEIYFSDNGIGIPDDKAKFIFSLWSSNTDGSGIGLTTSKDIIEDHNGKILYVNLNEEKINTTFLINIPIYN